MNLIPMNVVALMILSLLFMLAGCVAPAKIVLAPTEAIEIIKEVLIPIPEELTKQVEIPQLNKNPDTLQLGITYRMTVTRLMVCNRMRAEIATLGETP